MMQEVEQAFTLKRAWRSAVYSLEVQIIDTQAALIKSQNDQNRNFDKNFKLSEAFLKVFSMRERERDYKALLDERGAEGCSHKV
jgi:hypothetical protein